MVKKSELSWSKVLVSRGQVRPRVIPLKEKTGVNMSVKGQRIYKEA